jgi:2-oxo-3-hexenedioate decarboxylase
MTTLHPYRRCPPTILRSTWRVLTTYSAEIERRRGAQGWKPIGRKIGFTNRTIWSRYGVYQPMWAHVWTHTVHFASDGNASLSLHGLVQPRIEPEVVFKLSAPVPVTDDAVAILRCIEWMAPGFEIVQSHFPDWKFTAADCTAAFGLHGALVVGAPVAITDENRAIIAATLPTFALTLRRGDDVIDEGIGANVLGSPTLALAHLVQVLAEPTCRTAARRRLRSSPPVRSPTPGQSHRARPGAAIMALCGWRVSRLR